MDRLTTEHRSWNMSRIRSRNTTPERVVRSLLHRLGYRFRLHRSDLPGNPDIVLPRYRTVIFVHGCFWHRHSRCRNAYFPKSNVRFWKEKFLKNIKRDANARRRLRLLGWRTIVIWECMTLSRERLADRLKLLLFACN
jgi:DNA mismatch endonuclease (patch repair protein)